MPTSIPLLPHPGYTDVLPAIMHGYGGTGCRSPDATLTCTVVELSVTGMPVTVRHEQCLSVIPAASLPPTGVFLLLLLVGARRVHGVSGHAQDRLSQNR